MHQKKCSRQWRMQRRCCSKHGQAMVVAQPSDTPPPLLSASPHLVNVYDATPLLLPAAAAAAASSGAPARFVLSLLGVKAVCSGCDGGRGARRCATRHAGAAAALLLCCGGERRAASSRGMIRAGLNP